MRRDLAVGLAAVALAAVALLAAPVGVVPLVHPHAPAPLGLGRPVAEFGDVLVDQLERPPLTHSRFVGLETGPNRLAILYFELRTYPFVGDPEQAFVVSRCVELEALDPSGMGGGIVDGDPSADRELTYLRSAAQPACAVPLRP